MCHFEKWASIVIRRVEDKTEKPDVYSQNVPKTYPETVAIAMTSAT